MSDVSKSLRVVGEVKDSTPRLETYASLTTYTVYEGSSKHERFAVSESDELNYLPLVKLDGDKVVEAILLTASARRTQKEMVYKTQIYANEFSSALGRSISPRIKYAERTVLQKFKEKRGEEGPRSEFNFSSNYQSDLSDYVTFAMKHGASDIHIEGRRSEPGGRVRVRINGKLVDYLENIQWSYTNNQIRYLYSNLTKGGDQSFNEQKAQNGVIDALPLPGLKDTRLRVATTSTVDGVDMVLRLLPISEMTAPTPLIDQGYTQKQAGELLAGINVPYGLILIAGTTGSGKSTTLANLLMTRIQKDHGESKVITVENPVEYRLPSATQIQVQDTADGSDPWVNAIRACMRLDPDLLMVGEIRDIESAKLVRGAVQTGHPCLSTVHASNGLVIVDRLEGLGIHRDVLSAPDFLEIIGKQDLLQKLCAHCSIPLSTVLKKPSLLRSKKPLIQRLNMVANYMGQSIDGLRFKNTSNDCQYCKGYTPGISGRTVCAEVIKPDRTMLSLFKHASKADDAKAYWLNQFPGEAQIDVAWQRVCAGLIDPVDAEKKLGRFDYIVKRNKEYGVKR